MYVYGYTSIDADGDTDYNCKKWKQPVYLSVKDRLNIDASVYSKVLDILKKVSSNMERSLRY